MKQFLKMLLAVICGFIIVNLLVIAFFAGLIGSAASSAGGGSAVLPREGVLTIDLSEVLITEQDTPADPVAMIQGQTQVPLGIYKAVQAVEIAATDPGVKYIYLRPDGNTCGLSTLGELRKALENFRRSGKAVITYTENPNLGTYYLASVSDKIYVSSYQGGNYNFAGLCAQSFYLKDLLDKFGVNMQLIRHGKYKSAGEMYVRNAPSEENKEQYQRLVDSMWESISGTIAESRDIPVEDLDRMIDNLELCLPEDFEAEGLADGILSREELKEKLATLAVAGSFKDVKFIPFADYANAKVLVNYKVRDKIAVIYANGEIIDGRDVTNVAGDRFAAEIDKVRADSHVKAVVLRVNSPGGSVFASEKIKHELDLLAAQVPVIASYGEMAASGGYWISNNCSKIFSNATTLTGSIGVFGMIPEASKGIKSIAKVGTFEAKSHRHADMVRLTRPLDPVEYKYMERSIEAVYDKFTTIVSEGRGIEKAKVDEIGQGRVWTGADGLGIGLVDEIGTLSDAIAYAASAAGLESWQICEYPKPLTSLEVLMQSFGQTPEHQYVKALGKLTEPQVIARMPYQITVY